MPEDTLPAKHISRSATRRKVDQRIKRVRRELLVDAPAHVNPRRFKYAIETGARAIVLTRDAYEFLRERGMTNEDGELRSSVDVVQRLLSTTLKILRELNLTPAAMGKLRNERPIDLVGAMSENDGKDDTE